MVNHRIFSHLMPKKITQVFVHNVNKKFRLKVSSLKKLAEKILENENAKAVLNLIFVDDGYMKRLNRKFLGKNKTTDVLSFPFELDSNKDSTFLGEVYISLEQARRQAKEYQVSFSDELKRLVTHGVLHLLGYDHKTQKEALEMSKKEGKYLRANKG